MTAIAKWSDDSFRTWGIGQQEVITVEKAQVQLDQTLAALESMYASNDEIRKLKKKKLTGRTAHAGQTQVVAMCEQCNKHKSKCVCEVSDVDVGSSILDAPLLSKQDEIVANRNKQRAAAIDFGETFAVTDSLLKEQTQSIAESSN